MTNLIVGILAVIFGAVVVIFGGRWGAAGRKYDSENARRSAPSAGPDRISDWDSLSGGADPSDESTDEVEDPPTNIR